jgi:hypothetical protein
MMNYAKSKDQAARTDGLIWVGRDPQNDHYYVQSRNLVDLQDRQKIEPKLNEILSMDSETLKARYRELRRNGLYAHEHGGGIGFYEIAKRAQSISCQFVAIGNDKFYFDFKATIAVKK